MPLNKDLFIGFDGGGTKTICIIGDAAGTIIATATGDSTNLKSRPPEKIREVIHNLLSKVLQIDHITINQIKGVYVSTAGGDREEDRNRWKDWIMEYGLKPLHLIVNNDAVGALASGTKSKNGIVLIAGTGSIAYSVRDELTKPIRVGGWGYLFGDEGSGFYIGNEALRMIMRSHDGRDGKRQVLSDYILKQLKLEQPEQLITYIYENHYPRQLIASLAKYVIQLAEQGEPNAMEIIDHAIEFLGDLVFSIFYKDELSRTLSLVISGGLFHSRYFKELFENRMRIKGFEQEIILPNYPPIVGSYICALLQHGELITEELEENLYNSWERALTFFINMEV